MMKALLLLNFTDAETEADKIHEKAMLTHLANDRAKL